VVQLVQILMCWDDKDPESVKMVERLQKGFDKMGCWKVELPPKGSIYKLMIVVEKANMKGKGAESNEK